MGAEMSPSPSGSKTPLVAFPSPEKRGFRVVRRERKTNNPTSAGHLNDAGRVNCARAPLGGPFFDEARGFVPSFARRQRPPNDTLVICPTGDPSRRAGPVGEPNRGRFRPERRRLYGGAQHLPFRNASSASTIPLAAASKSLLGRKNRPP